jgi:dolichol-phosphate mannosyltransferase
MPASSPSVSIIIPTRNEVENISPLTSAIIAAGVAFDEIVFVDDHSSDGTIDVIRSFATNHPVRLVEQNSTQPGLAAAILAGAAAAKSEFLVVMDSDLSHPPERINDLLAPLRAGAADMVIGSRYVEGGSTPGWPFWRRMLSRAGSALAYPVTGVHDAMCGFFAIARSRLLEFAGPAIGFKIAFEVIARGRRNLKVIEIPIAFKDRVRGRSKMSFGIALRFFWRWLSAAARRIARQ